jgi:Holliday junction resolvase RusA-like endonuclease
MTEIELPGIPLPWRAPYVGTRGSFSPRTAVMNDLRMWLRSTYTGPFFTEAINCSFYFYMPIPKATSKKKRAQMLKGEIRPITKPDRTNLCKLSEDVLQGVVYANDSQIVGGVVEKWFSENPKTLVKVENVATLLEDRFRIFF